MINIPQRRDPTDEFLQDNGLADIPTGTTVVDNGNSSIIIDSNTNNNQLHDMPEGQIPEDEHVNMFEDPWANTDQSVLDNAAGNSGNPMVIVDQQGNTVATINSEEAPSLEEPENSGESEESEPEEVAPQSELSDDEVHELFNSDAESLLDEAVKASADTIPENTVKHVNDEARVRFSDATWFKKIQESTIILAGLGGIGSYILYCLSKMNPKQIFIYDDDNVEMVNLAGQLYSKSMIGSRKVDSMAKLAEDFSDYHGVQAIPQKFTKDTPTADIMICGFDNMDARKTFFYAWKKHVEESSHPEKCLYLDGRLNAEEFQIFCITGDDTYSIDKYGKEQLFDDWRAEEAICSYKQTAYCANMIGSVMTNLFVNFIANQLDGMPRALPYFTYYDASMMYFKTEG